MRQKNWIGYNIKWVNSVIVQDAYVQTSEWCGPIISFITQWLAWGQERKGCLHSNRLGLMGQAHSWWLGIVTPTKRWGASATKKNHQTPYLFQSRRLWKVHKFDKLHTYKDLLIYNLICFHSGTRSSLKPLFA